MRPIEDIYINTFIIFSGFLALIYLFAVIEDPSKLNIGFLIIFSIFPVGTLLEWGGHIVKNYKKWNSKTK